MAEPKNLYSYKLKWVKEDTILNNYQPIGGPHDIAKMLYDFYEDADREYFTIVLLNTKNKVIGVHNVTMGILNASMAHPREVFKAACMGSAASIILAHNHPSGDCMPSDEDEKLTHHLVKCGKLMEIPVLDHLVIGDHCFCSLAQRGIL